jgi:transmembrane sensor
MKRDIEMEHTDFWELTARILNNEAGDAEQTRYQGMLAADHDLAEKYQFLHAHWDRLKLLDLNKSINTKDEWLALKSRIENLPSERPGRSRDFYVLRISRRWLPYAASLIGLIMAGSIWLTFFGSNAQSVPAFTTIEAPLGSRAHVVLPDGSDIWLNAGSTLRYEKDFNERNRHVTLLGEAFFNVKKQETPFVVNTSDINIHVLGTAFNVKAYAEDAVIEATLVSGSLLIAKATDIGPRFDDILLKPNQKAIFSKKEGVLSINERQRAVKEKEPDSIMPQETLAVISGIKIQSKSDLTGEIGWKDGILIVEREPLRTFVRKLERRYNVNFVIEGEYLKEYHYTGRLHELSLEQVMQAMKLTSPIDYTILDRTVILRENPENMSDYNNVPNKPN